MVYSCYGFPAGTTSYDISISPTILDLFFSRQDRVSPTIDITTLLRVGFMTFYSPVQWSLDS